MFNTITEYAQPTVCVGAGAIGISALFGLTSLLTFGYAAMALGGVVISLELIYKLLVAIKNKIGEVKESRHTKKNAAA